jgi:regulation of enolase protein 1 (concanavalin A-like superfamily)
MSEQIRQIVTDRQQLTPYELAYIDESPILEPWARVLQYFDQYFKQRFKLITEDKERGFFPEVSDLNCGERFGYYDLSGFVDDPGLENSGDNFKMFRARLTIEEGFESMFDLQMGKAAMAIRLDDEIPRFKFAIPDGAGIFHESVVEGDINSRTFVNTNKKPHVWIAITDCAIAFRIVVQKDQHRLHDYTFHDFGTETPYNLNEWNLNFQQDNNC